MEQAAKDEVTKAANVATNEFSGLVQMVYVASSDALVFSCTFDLNGKKMDVSVSFPKHQIEEGEVNPMLHLRDAVAQKIATIGMETWLDKVGARFL